MNEQDFRVWKEIEEGIAYVENRIIELSALISMNKTEAENRQISESVEELQELLDEMYNDD